MINKKDIITNDDAQQNDDKMKGNSNDSLLTISTIAGEIELSEEEIEVISLNPKHQIVKKLSEEQMEIEV